MTEKDKEFYVFELGDLGIYHINTFSAEFSNKRHAQEICDKLNNLHEEKESLKTQNHRLKEGILFFIHIASAKLEDRDTYCEMVFNCNYAEAKKEYGTIIKRLLEE